LDRRQNVQLAERVPENRVDPCRCHDEQPTVEASTRAERASKLRDPAVDGICERARSRHPPGDPTAIVAEVFRVTVEDFADEFP